MKIKVNGSWVDVGTYVRQGGQWVYTDPFVSPTEIVVYITSTSTNVNAQTLFGSYWTQNIRKRLVINPGVVVGSRYTSTPALNIPSGAVSTLTIDNYGSIQGAGGYPDIIRTTFLVTREASANDTITFTGPNSFTFANWVAGYQDQLVYTNTNYSLSGSTDSCGWSLRIIAPNAIGLDDNQGCGPDGDYNDIIVYISQGYFFESGGTIYYRIDSPYGNGPTGGNAILASSAVSINNLGTIYSGGGGGGLGGAGGGGYYTYDCSYTACGGGSGWWCADYFDDACRYQNGSSSYCVTPNYGPGSGCCGSDSDGNCVSYTIACCNCCTYYSQTCTAYTSGGAGGSGGQGQGYDQNLTAGSAGFPGGTNAGTGGSGGTGGNWGATGSTGGTGSNGNYTNGSAGSTGGLAGYYIVNNGNVTWISTGTRLGRVG